MLNLSQIFSLEIEISELKNNFDFYKELRDVSECKAIINQAFGLYKGLIAIYEKELDARTKIELKVLINKLADLLNG